MQKLLFILFFLLTAMVCFCQIRPTTSGFSARSNQTFVVEDGNLSARNSLFVPRFADSTEAATYILKDTLGNVVYFYSTQSLWVRTIASGSTKKWTEIGSGGGSGITIGTTTITSGINTRVLFNNSGVAGEYSISGTGNVAMTTSSVFTNPRLASTSTTGHVWTATDAIGNGSFQASSGANTALSNLASVAINTSLISDANNTDDLGSTSLAWKDIYSYSNKLKGPTSGEITLAAVATAGTNTITFPATTGDVVVTAGAQTIAGAKSFTNQALFSDGTTGAPGIAFSSATNFGLRFTPSSMQLVASGGDKLGVYSGGVILSSNFLTSGFTTIFNSAGVPGAGFSPNLSATTTNLLLKTGTATVAPLKFTAGTNLTTPEAGAVEFDGTNYFGTASTTRYTFAKSLTNTATLDFASTAPSTSTDLTITVTGAADGDAVTIGVPNGSTNANSCYTAFVSAANTVTIRFNNYQTVGNIDPASGTFRASVLKY